MSAICSWHAVAWHGLPLFQCYGFILLHKLHVHYNVKQDVVFNVSTSFMCTHCVQPPT